MDTGALRAYVERSRKLVESSPKLSERNTQVRLVQPFLTALGWELHQIAADHRVPTPDGPVTVDFALLVDGEPAVLVETAACAADLDRERAERLGRTLLETDVDRGILTNGRGFAFLAAESGDLVRFECRLAELPDDADAVGRYARDAVERRLTDARRRRREAAEALAAERDDVVEDVGDRLVAATGDAVAKRLRAESERFVDGLIESLRDEGDDGIAADGETVTPDGVDSEDPVTARAASESGADATATLDADASAGDDPSVPDDSTEGAAVASRADVPDDALGAAVADDGQYVVRFFGDRTSVWAVGHARAAMTTARAIEYLLQRGESDALSAPWGPDGERAVLLDDAVENATIELSNGWHLDARVPVDTARDAIEELAGHVGLRAMFQDEWSAGA